MSARCASRWAANTTRVGGGGREFGVVQGTPEWSAAALRARGVGGGGCGLSLAACRWPPQRPRRATPARCPANRPRLPLFPPPADASFRDLTRPAVLKDAGVIIEPLRFSKAMAQHDEQVGGGLLALQR